MCADKRTEAGYIDLIELLLYSGCTAAPSRAKFVRDPSLRKIAEYIVVERLGSDQARCLSQHRLR